MISARVAAHMGAGMFIAGLSLAGPPAAVAVADTASPAPAADSPRAASSGARTSGRAGAARPQAARRPSVSAPQGWRDRTVAGASRAAAATGRPRAAAVGSWLGGIVDATAALRNAVTPIFFNRTPVVTPLQVETKLAAGASSAPVGLAAFDPDGDRLDFAVPARGAPGGPAHGSVTVDNATRTFIYRADDDFTGTDSFSVVATDTGLHLHAWANLLNAAFGVFATSLAGGHRDTATVTIFNNVGIHTDPGSGAYTPISGDFTVMTYNIAGLPFPLSSAQLPRMKHTREIGARMTRAADIVGVQEDFAYHPFLVGTAGFPDRTPPHVPTWLWPIGVPFSDGLNIFSAFPTAGLQRHAWWDCHADNCLTPKGFSYSRVQLPGGEEMDVYNLHANTGGGDFTNANIAQLSDYLQQNSAGRAVIVMGDWNERYSDPGQTLSRFAEANGLIDAWLEVVPGATDTATYADTCDYADTCEQLDKIFYRSAIPLNPADPSSSPVRLQATAYRNLGQQFLTGDGTDLSDHRPQAVSFRYTVRNDGPAGTPLP